ncbi:hypothetical protein FALBO_14980 [Fusarium albosuccineum]|uniref:Uncharacterized protein n=1 Tax=Fusarium albosuccineum TaxID=1237068 RepID=A0A8H4KY70_9HYPO|nr:hypothetical protein FALBO_14980 [Fusarium albosuccineum]
MIFPPFVPGQQDVFENMGSGSQAPAAPLQIPDHIARMGFHLTMDLTWMQSWNKMVLLLSSPGSQASYSVDMPEGWGGPTVLYPDQNAEGAPMTYVDRAVNGFTFYLPAIPSWGVPPSQVAMENQYHHSDTRYQFSMVVASGYTESFEWRRAGRREMRSLGMSRSGWKLVRLTYGNEVVAGFSEEKDLSMPRVGTFSYLGSGSTAELGYHWMLMAVISGIVVFQHVDGREQAA